MNARFLTTIFLSSAISAFTVLIVLGKIGQDETKGKTPQRESWAAKTSLDTEKQRQAGSSAMVTHSRKTSDPGKIDGEQESGVLKRDVQGSRNSSVNSDPDSNPHKTAQTFYVTRNQYRENHIDSASAATSDRNPGETHSAAVAYVAGPVNPQPGMIANAYAVEEWMDADMLQRSNVEVPKMTASMTFADRGETFSAVDANAAVMRWDGFIKCKRPTTITFLLSKSKLDGWDNGYSIRINNDLTCTGYGENAIDADLKLGWNRVEIICQFKDKLPLDISYRPKGSLSKPCPISPKDLFHDHKPEEVWQY